MLKYVSKNSDVADVSIKEYRYCGQKVDNEDYLRKYASSRVVSAVEAYSSLAGYNKYGMKPSVSIISIHLPDERILSIPFGEDPVDYVKKKEIPSSNLERYFLRPDDHSFDDIKICDYFGLYSFITVERNYPTDKGITKKSVRKKKYSFILPNWNC